MEGCDGAGDGTPGELTVRRYHRFAHGGPGLIWFEATAILPEARANPRQMMLTEKNADAYKKLLDGMREISVRENGYAPLIICQLTHSGRYSKPNGYPEPLVAQHRPLFEGDKPPRIASCPTMPSPRSPNATPMRRGLPRRSGSTA